MREEVARLVHDLDPLLAVGDADMHVQPEDEELADDVLQLLLEDLVPLLLGDLLLLPVRERVRAGGHEPQAIAPQEGRERAAGVRDLPAGLAHVGANARADLDHRLHHLGLHPLLEIRTRGAQERPAVALQLPVAIDDLELFLDADGEPLDLPVHDSTI